MVYHRKDPRFRTAYRQFNTFAYQVVIREPEKQRGCWPGILTRKDFDAMIQYRFRNEMEKRYGQEVQTLCKTHSFGLASESNLSSGEINQAPLENIIHKARSKALLLASMVMSVGPSRNTLSLPPSTTSSRLTSMKIIKILVILCRSTHRDNSNYIPLLIALYLYFAGARVDAITLLNHLGLSVSYDVLQKKLQDITKSTLSWIKPRLC